MATTRRPRFGRVVARASTRGTNLGVAGAALLGAAALHSWPLVGLGALAYAAMVAFDVANPRFWQRTSAAPSLPAELPDPAQLADETTRQAVRGLVAARGELGRVLADTPAEVRVQLAVALTSVGELERRAARLVARAEDLSRYLASVDVDGVRGEASRLDERARSVADAEARAEYQRAHEVRREHLGALADVTGGRERILANLARIGATLEALPAKIVRLRALDAQAMDHLSGDVNQELDAFNHEIQSFEETLQSLAEVPSA